jgi:NAD(P)-dependent dehydrogenase (short-subunit alcohol dehydrogenase family)
MSRDTWSPQPEPVPKSLDTRIETPRPGVGLAIGSTLTAALPALTANLALELAPIRVNFIAAGFVDTPLSASLLGDQLEARRQRAARRAPDKARRGAG